MADEPTVPQPGEKGIAGVEGKSQPIDSALPKIGTFRYLLNPVVLIPLMLLGSIVWLIFAAGIGLDTVLFRMEKVEFARGLITYLYAVVTIGTAVLLVVSVLTGDESDVQQKRFERAKDILALLLGVFGTIVGYYFGSEVTRKPEVKQGTVLIAPLHLGAQSVNSGGTLDLETYVSGGTAPYKFGVDFGGAVVMSDKLTTDSWVEEKVTVPVVSAEQSVTVHFFVTDANGNKAEVWTPFVDKPK